MNRWPKTGRSVLGDPAKYAGRACWTSPHALPFFNPLYIGPEFEIRGREGLDVLKGGDEHLVCLAGAIGVEPEPAIVGLEQERGAGAGGNRIGAADKGDLGLAGHAERVTIDHQLVLA